MKKVIEVKNLVKKYKNLTAVDGIHFSVKKGETFALLGENGAGKTTTLEIIEGLRTATAGKVKILGQDVSSNIIDIKERIGVQLQSSAYFNYLTLREILELMASFYKKRLDSDKLFEMVDLKDKADSFLPELSGGQRQRFSIIASLINDPEIVFLDEPTTGLDPLARRNLWQVINRIKAQGKTIVLTTHYLEEAEQLSDRAAIMEKGKILIIGEPYQLIRRINQPYKIELVDQNLSEDSKQKLAKFGIFSSDENKKGTYHLRLKTQEKVNQALDQLEKTKPETFTLTRASLEDLFIQLTGRQIKH